MGLLWTEKLCQKIVLAFAELEELIESFEELIESFEELIESFAELHRKQICFLIENVEFLSFENQEK